MEWMIKLVKKNDISRGLIAKNEINLKKVTNIL